VRGNAHYRFIYNVIFQDIAAHREPKVHSSQQRNLYATYFSGGEIAFVHPYSSKVSFLDRSQCRLRAFEGLHLSNAIQGKCQTHDHSSGAISTAWTESEIFRQKVKVVSLRPPT